jgi:hypothetical protein
LLAANRTHIAHPDIDVASFFCLALVGGLTRDGLLAGAALANSRMDARKFIAELKRSVFAYLGVETDAA